jgi:CDGSH-type Zn-finger protein
MSAGAGAPASITACPDGPLLVRGDIRLLDEHGESLASHRRTVALCRCGASAIRPLCDGTHKTIGFRTRPPARTPAVTYQPLPVEDDDADEPATATAAAGMSAAPALE